MEQLFLWSDDNNGSGITQVLLRAKGKTIGDRVKNFSVDGIRFNFIAVPGGTTTLGLPREKVVEISRQFPGVEVAVVNSFPPRQVNVRPFWILENEISEHQWAAVMDPTKLRGAKYAAQVNVSYEAVQLFLQKLSKMLGRRVQLPSEAEFERAVQLLDPTGREWPTDTKTTCLSRSARSSAQQFTQRERGVNIPAKLLGGVWEMTRDPWRSFGSYDVVDQGAITLRGGCEACAPHECLPASRWGLPKNDVSLPYMGFRPVAYFQQ